MNHTDQIHLPYVEGADIVDVQKLVEDSLHKLPFVDASDLLRFVGPLLLYLRDWLEVNTNTVFDDSECSVFVYTEHPRLEGEPHGFDSVRWFNRERRHVLVGHLHLCSIDVTNVVRKDLPGSDAPAAAQKLEELGFTDRPTVLFHPGRREASLYGVGIADEGSCINYHLEAPGCIKEKDLEKLLVKFHEGCLKVPNRMVGVWKDASNHTPIREPEKEIQKYLFLLLRVSLNMRVEDRYIAFSELDVNAGRADICIFPPPKTSCDRFVLELKVLRSCYSSGNECTETVNKNAIVKGIDQAREYSDHTSSQHAFLCCYDMRRDDDDSIVSELAPLAGKRDVRLKRFYMYNSPEKARRERPDSAYSEWKSQRQ